ncbi:MAG: uroporphyrinogen-III C-methyltransferase, partial [candidate division NC10 bacterium]|nr:uroporphyrinogen-III C-methyltransferase [candidate division NC10 bacterium]
GPGDPGLITVKGLKCLKEADVIVYDHLVDERLLAHGKPDAERLYVGKHEHRLPQEEINRLLVERAKAGKIVVRLKGGDPFIFGRGGEEAEALASAEIPFEMVPGVTSGVAVPAYAGIPLTHRDLASSVAFLTGHEDPIKEEPRIAWERLATGIDTLVILMGVKKLPEIVRKLVEHGRDPKTPIAVIRCGTTAEQETVEGTLETIVEKAKELKPPAICVIGQVVSLRPTLLWFEKKPLFGKRILVTRAREQALVFAELLEAYGAEVIQVPTIRISPPEDFTPLDSAIDRLEQYHWLLFTSINGVGFFLERLRAQGKDLRELKGIKVSAIGPGTAAALEQAGIKPDIVAAEFRAEGLVEALKEAELVGASVLLPRAEVARDILPEELRKRGARVDVVTAYRTVKVREEAGRVKQLLEERKIHIVTFTSSSTVRNLMEMLQGEDLKGLFAGVTVACIGPITAEAAAKFGLETHIMPEAYTIPALAEAIAKSFRPGGSLEGL